MERFKQDFRFAPVGDERLHHISEYVSPKELLSGELDPLFDYMVHTAQGDQRSLGRGVMVGLAAPQLGVNKRIILVATEADGNGKVGGLEFFVNPEYIWSSRQTNTYNESCFSVDPLIRGSVNRPSSIAFRALTRDCKPVVRQLSGYPARVFGHEKDHLDGNLFTDRVKKMGKLCDLHFVPSNMRRAYAKTWRNWPYHF